MARPEIVDVRTYVQHPTDGRVLAATPGRPMPDWAKGLPREYLEQNATPDPVDVEDDDQPEPVEDDAQPEPESDHAQRGPRGRARKTG